MRKGGEWGDWKGPYFCETDDFFSVPDFCSISTTDLACFCRPYCLRFPYFSDAKNKGTAVFSDATPVSDGRI